MANRTNLDFVSVQVRDLEAARAFYTDVIGFSPSDEGPENAVVFQHEGTAIFAIRAPMRPLPEQGPLGIGSSLWFDSQDVESLYERVQASAGAVMGPPQPGPFGKQLTIADPDGYVLVFHEYKGTH